MHRSFALYKETSLGRVKCIKGGPRKRSPERKWASATTIRWVEGGLISNCKDISSYSE